MGYLLYINFFIIWPYHLSQHLPKQSIKSEMINGPRIHCSCKFTCCVMHFYNLPSQEEHSVRVVKLANEQIAKYEAEVCNVKISVNNMYIYIVVW